MIAATTLLESHVPQAMRKYSAILALSAAMVMATSCSTAPAVDTAAEAAALVALDEQWSAAALKNDLDATVAFYSNDAVVLAPNAPIATDRKSIRDSWAGLLGPGTALSWKVTKAEVAKSGELGYVYGAYSLRIQDPNGGAPIEDTGKLLEVWKKQADGKWKCIVDTYNSDLPLPAPPPPEKAAKK